jgi:hypothetical protein
MAARPVTGLAIMLCAVGMAQENGRFATLKSQAFDLFDRGQYAEVAGKLEEIWEQDRNDTKVGEYLAMGYLYGEKDAAKAGPVMKEAVMRGGQATFIVHHSHEKGILAGDTINNYCAGKMSIVPGKMTFLSEIPDHSTAIAGIDLKEFRVLGGAPGRVEIKAGGKTWIFRVKSETRAEANLFEEMAEQNLKKK